VLRFLRLLLLVPGPLLWVLLLGAYFNLLGSFPGTDAGFSLLLALVVLSPLLPLVGLVFEILRRRYRRRHGLPTSRRSLLVAGIAWILGLVGALVVLAGVRM